MAEVISETKNTPDAEKIVVVRSYKILKFHIPYGVDLEDKNIVKEWDASNGELVIKYAKHYKGKQVIDFFEEHDDDDPFVEIEEAESSWDYEQYDKYVGYDLRHVCDECKEPTKTFVENCYGIHCFPCAKNSGR